MDTTLHYHVPDDIRFGEIIKHEDGKIENHWGDLVLVGFPFDIGVSRNNGRPGANEGPIALRRLMKRVGAVVNEEYGIDLRKLKVSDCGNIDSTVTLEEGHKLLRDCVRGILSEGKIPFIVGGGNDQSYPNAAALLDATNGSGPVSIINIDAHLDVRPLKNGLAHSGSPFRLLLEDKRFDGKGFVEFGCQGSQCSSEHVKYIKSKGGNIVWLREIKEGNETVKAKFEKLLDNLGDNIFVSFDLDAVSGCDAPGVSAPGVIGLSSKDAIDICFVAGKHPKVRLFDLSEFNPLVEEFRTGKLVANMFYYFALGLTQRQKI